jgi:hypothetical protein
MSSSSRSGAPDAARRAWLAAALGAPFGPLVRAQVAAPPDVRSELPAARLRGQGTLRFLGLHVYDALLWSEEPLPPDAFDRRPIALELRYARPLRGLLIAERSLEEMRQIDAVSSSDAERWLATMKKLFPDVQAGDRITGIHRPDEGARFHHNGRFLGEVPDPRFARLFFAIWLSPRTSEPRLRASLLGLG